MHPEEIRRALVALRSNDVPTHGGRTLAYVYDPGIAEADAVGREALAAYGATNALDPTAFPSLLVMEQELIGLAADLLGGPPETVGTFTSGGTESVLLAVQAARDGRPDIGHPTMVLPTSAHAAFHKAAHYFRVEPIFVDVDPATGRALAPAMAQAIRDDTVLVVASAPSYAHGVVDPVTEIAGAAAERGIRCHVDACIGGWLLPYLREDDPNLPAFDFSAPGVTSISVDLHKYGYTPKGASLLLHRNSQLRRSQLFSSAAWPGYTMINTTIQSTKSGGPLAAAWAVTRLIGDEGYRRLARDVRDGVRALVAGIADINPLRVLLPPDASLIAVAADDQLDIFAVSDELSSRGWFTQPQLTFGPFPATLHLSLSAATLPLIPELLADLGTAVAVVKGREQPVPDAALLESLAALQPADLTEETFDRLLAAAGIVAGELPPGLAGVNALVDRLAPPMREAVLTAYIDRLTRPRR